MSPEKLDISPARDRDEKRMNRETKKLNQERGEDVKRRRGLIEAIILCFALGAGSGLLLTKIKMPIDGPDSLKIPLIQKFKYEINDWWDGIRKTDVDKPEEKIQTPEKSKDDSKIHIDLKLPAQLDCDSIGEDCLIS